MMLLLALLLGVYALLWPASGIQIVPDDNGLLPLRNSYDYIVVGAGIGGLVVANRLSEDVSGTHYITTHTFQRHNMLKSYLKCQFCLWKQESCEFRLTKSRLYFYSSCLF